ncbi:MAG: hypothetical protein CVV64_04220 [Candidatus Wallbacteria bacterium HGW-Wallbacteria-1]|jgi:hypothetical protein|uniref:Uncharacterized protein n=1 Tax=Candidatus Wallbacteria bacterium HGW-Wallbacteria-1 TaxID=2013854 RepID=A0A2N1PRL6_9BACT|nr:MAG: hypothetical protein CVV64_04220 [Candidatus Wallbacteria bacterium HGW-Wallbacteria-1]
MKYPPWGLRGGNSACDLHRRLGGTSEILLNIALKENQCNSKNPCGTGVWEVLCHSWDFEFVKFHEPFIPT